MHSIKFHTNRLELDLTLNMPSNVTMSEALQIMCDEADILYDKAFDQIDEDQVESPEVDEVDEPLIDDSVSEPDSEGDMLHDQRSYCDDEKVVENEDLFDNSARGQDSEGDMSHDQQSTNSGPTARDGGRGDTEQHNDDEHSLENSTTEPNSEGVLSGEVSTPATEPDSDEVLSDEDLMHDDAKQNLFGPQIVIRDEGAYGHCDHCGLTDHTTAHHNSWATCQENGKIFKLGRNSQLAKAMKIHGKGPPINKQRASAPRQPSPPPPTQPANTNHNSISFNIAELRKRLHDHERLSDDPYAAVQAKFVRSLLPDLDLN